MIYIVPAESGQNRLKIDKYETWGNMKLIILTAAVIFTFNLFLHAETINSKDVAKTENTQKMSRPVKGNHLAPRFPLGLKPGQTPADVSSLLTNTTGFIFSVNYQYPAKLASLLPNTTGISEMGSGEDTPPNSQSFWGIGDIIAFGDFSPELMSARFFQASPEGTKKLFWVILSKMYVDSCDLVQKVFNDAVKFVKSNYTFPGAEIIDSGKLGEPGCSDFMESNKVIWSAKQKDWWVYVTANYKSNYTVEVNYIYRPIGDAKVKAQEQQEEEKKGATRQRL